MIDNESSILYSFFAVSESDIDNKQAVSGFSSGCVLVGRCGNPVHSDGASLPGFIFSNISKRRNVYFSEVESSLVLRSCPAL